MFGLGFRLAADIRRPARRSSCAENIATRLGAGSVEEILGAPEFHESEFSAQRRAGGRTTGRLDRLDRDVAEDLLWSGSPGAPQRLDRWGRRLGLRHRRWRPGPRAGQRTQRQRAGAGHRGLLQHRRAGPPRPLRWAWSPSSPPAASARRARTWPLQAIAYGELYVAQVAIGANPEQTLIAFCEAEALARAVAEPGLQPLHRPRLRPSLRDAPAGSRGRLELLAAVRFTLPCATPARRGSG